MAIPIDIIIKALGLDTFSRVGQGARSMGSTVTEVTGNISREFKTASDRYERLEAILKKRPGSLGLQTATQQAKDLRDGLRDAALQASKTNDAIAKIKAPNIPARLQGFNTLLQSSRDRADKYSAVTDTATTVGVGGLAIGGAGIAGGISAAMTAGEVRRARGSFQRKLGPEEGDRFFQSLIDFDKQSPVTNLRETIDQAQSALAQGLKPGEIIDWFNGLGDGIADAGKGVDEFAASIRQLTQIRGKGKASMQDIHALAEGGGLPVIPILTKELGAERVKGVLSGDEPIEAEEFFRVFFKGLKDASGGAMANAMKELPGEVSNLQSSWFLLRSEMGDHLVPMVSTATRFLTGAADAFSALPDPLQKIIALGGETGFALVGVAGGALAVSSQIGQVLFGLKALKDAGGLGGLVPVLGSVKLGAQGAIAALMGSGGLAGALTIGLPIAIATGVGLIMKSAIESAVKAAEEANESPDVGKDLPSSKTREGALAQAADFERRAKEMDEKIAARKEVRGRSWPYNIMEGKSLGTIDNEISTLKAEQDNYYKEAQKLRARAGTLPSTPTTPSTETPSMPAVPGIPTSLPVVPSTAALGGLAGAPIVPSYEPQIRALEDQIRGSKDKKEKSELREQLVTLRRAETDRKRAETAANKAERGEMRAARIGGGVLDERLESQLRIAQAREDSASKSRMSQSQAALEAQVNAIEMQRDNEEISEAEVARRIGQLKAAYERTRAAEEAAHREKMAEQESSSILAQARAEAQGRQAAESAAIMATARVKANEATSIAGIEASRIREEGDINAGRILSDSLAAANKAKSKERGGLHRVLALLRAGRSIGDLKDKEGNPILPNLRTQGPGSALQRAFNPNTWSGPEGANPFHRMLGAGGVPVGAGAGFPTMAPLGAGYAGGINADGASAAARRREDIVVTAKHRIEQTIDGIRIKFEDVDIADARRRSIGALPGV